MPRSLFPKVSSIILLLFLTAFGMGCVARGYTLRYPIDAQEPIASKARVGVEVFTDSRPTEERKNRLLVFGANSTSDNMFNEPVATTFTNQFLSELNARGLTAVRSFDGTPDYLIKGDIIHFQVSKVNPFFLPALGDAVLFWANRTYYSKAEVVITLRDSSGQVLIDQKHYTLSEEVEQERHFFDVEKTFRGESGIAEYARATLKNVLYQVSLDARTYVVQDEVSK